MLPGDTKKRKQEQEQAEHTLHRDLVEKQLSECVVKYTENAFQQATTEWLIAMDQVSNGLFYMIID